MQDAKTRANKRQQGLLVERLYNNPYMARGDQADADVREFWASLTIELNKLGCSRPVQKWQHIWGVWVAKVKTKARKIQGSTMATGDGQSISKLTNAEQKILDIVGTASINGFASIEVGIRPTLCSSSPASPLLPSVPSSQETQLPQHGVSACPIRRRPVRRRLPRPERPPVYDKLVHALQESSNSLQETIKDSAEVIAAALRDNSVARIHAAEIIAAAITSARDSSHNNTE